MKKLISILTIIIILLSLFSLSSFSLCADEKTSFVSEQEQFDESPILSSTDLQMSLQDNPLITHPDISNTSTITINETTDSFLKKITAQELALSGTVVEKTGNRSELSTFLKENSFNRFDLVNLAYNQRIINEEERIETYCALMENQQFENMTCLHEPIATLHIYRLSNPSNRELCDRISVLFTKPDNNDSIINNKESSSASTYSVSTQMPFSAYTSSHFTVAYPTTSNIQMHDASLVANYLESIREIYISEMGFREPPLDEGLSTYAVYLFEDSNGNNANIAGATTPVTTYGVACTSYIEIFNFSTLTTNIQQTIAHEYFHAIQGAYIWSQTNLWFYEAMANWGKIIVGESSTTCDEQINQYLLSTQPIHSSTNQGYGAVLYPLTTQATCGINAIKAIWEEFGEQTSRSLSFDQLKENVVDVALSEWDETFDSIYLRMAYRNFSPSTWYASVHPGGASALSSWTPRITTSTNTTPLSRGSYMRSVVTNYSINHYSSNYHKFIPDLTNKNSNLTINITFSGSDAADGVCFAYYVKSNGQHIAMNLIKSGTNQYTITNDVYGGDIAWYGIVVSNLGDSAITYSVKYRVERGDSTTVSLNTYHRYYENITNIGVSEYKDYYVTFSVGGTKLIQTFGTKNTHLLLFDSNGNQLAEDNDNGYGSNALIGYSFEANTEYKIRVTHYSYSSSGNIKLSITATGSYANYEAIYSRVDYTSGLGWSFVQNYAKVLTYKYTASQDLTMLLSSDIDVYLYIVDPSSTEPIQAANNTTPDLTKGSACLYNDDYNGIYTSRITKTFDANVPYFIVAAMYNPTAHDGNSFTITFN